ncbi:MAG TPA: hypothetical protein VH307_31290 [Streptosporangiaceae bacterium]|jgi:hypothetical protein|nr:hypothetical protein [Streptosporangiaceae bacterium]
MTQDTEPAAPHVMTPVPVHASGQDLAGGHQGTHFTMVISTATNPVVQLLGRDYDRIEARILTVDQPVVLAQTKEQAENAANQVTSVPAPVGSYLPITVDRVLRNGDEVWAAATSATATRISVIVSRRLPVASPALP